MKTVQTTQYCENLKLKLRSSQLRSVRWRLGERKLACQADGQGSIPGQWSWLSLNHMSDWLAMFGLDNFPVVGSACQLRKNSNEEDKKTWRLSAKCGRKKQAAQQQRMTIRAFQLRLPNSHTVTWSYLRSHQAFPASKWTQKEHFS